MNMRKSFHCALLLTSFIGLNSCATDNSEDSTLASDTQSCRYTSGFNLTDGTTGVVVVDPNKQRSQPGNQGTLVPNPGYALPDSRPLTPGRDLLPIKRDQQGGSYVDFPGGSRPDGSPYMAPEVLVTDQENYPYKTYQGAQPNCVPRAFEQKTGIYNPYLEASMTGDEKTLDVGDHHYEGRGRGVKPEVGDVVFYDLPQGRHAGIVAGFDDDGRAKIASGHQGRPWDYRAPEDIVQSYHEVDR